MDKTSRLKSRANSNPLEEAGITAEPSALELLNALAAPLETLGNLIYLAKYEAEDAEKIRQYMQVAEQQIAAIRNVARESFGVQGGIRKV